MDGAPRGGRYPSIGDASTAPGHEWWRFDLRRWSAVVGVTLLLLKPGPVQAHVGSGASCQNCHSTTRNGLSLTGFQFTTNLSVGVRKVFQVTSGGSARIGIQVTDGHNEYGLAFLNPDQGGWNNPDHHLLYQPDTTWTKRSGYYSLGPKKVNQSWTYTLGVQAGTPADLYPVTLRMAGTGGGRWTDTEEFYLQVLSPTPPTPLLVNPRREGDTFSCQVATTVGFTYYLEVSDSLGDGLWTVVDEVRGDGTAKHLSDATATAAAGCYRVRAQ